jgi:hypothetical protein
MAAPALPKNENGMSKISDKKIDELLSPQWSIKEVCESYGAVDIPGDEIYYIQFHRHGTNMV